MSRQKDEIARLETIIDRDQVTISDLRQKIADQNEELNQYRVAVSAVKWLWDQAGKQPPFQT